MFYKAEVLTRNKDEWKKNFIPGNISGGKSLFPLVSKGKVLVEAGKKFTPRLLNQLAEKNIKELEITNEELIGKFVSEDIVNMETGEIFGEVGHIIESPRTVTAVAITNSLIKVIDEKTVKEKMNKADPVLAAIIRGLSLRIGDANALAEKHWLELSLYKSLGK